MFFAPKTGTLEETERGVYGMEQGLVHIYCGDGKGKTTAAMGLCLRALGRGLRVGVCQFLKDGSSGEIAALRGFENVCLFPAQPLVKFVFAMNEGEKAEAAAYCSRLLKLAEEKAPELDLLLLDEACAAVETGLVAEEALLAFLRSRPARLELVLTGRSPSPALLESADYVSEIRAVRHPYDSGVGAREGIEF